jgi:hypothetical protein
MPMSRGEEARVATEAEVLSVLRYLSAAYPRVEMLPATIAVYVMQFLRARLPADALLLAAMNLVDSSEFVPSVAALRAEAERIEGERQGWYISANYRLFGHPLPAELCLPPGMGREWLGYEPEIVEMLEDGR